MEPPAVAALTSAAPAPFNPLDAALAAAPTTPAADTADVGQACRDPPQHAQQQQERQLALLQPPVPDLTVYLQQNTDIMHKLVEQMGDMRESIGACENLCTACLPALLCVCVLK